MTISTLTPERLAYLDLMREVEDFLYGEADLLDERDYDEWLDLFTEDVVYWMPMRKNVSFEDREKEITDEDGAYCVVPLDKTHTQYAQSPVTSEYFQQCWERRLKNKGDLAGTYPVVGNIFPNMSFHAQQPRTIVVSHPRGPNHTEMWRVYFVDKDAPKEVKQYLRDFYIRYSGPAAAHGTTCLENWNYATAASIGIQ